MLLSYMDDLIENHEKTYDNVYEIYDQLVSKWIEREALKNNKLLYEFSEKVAEYMYFNKTVYIGGEEIENLCKKYNIKLRSIEAKSRSLLNRNASGAYKFAHKSILEFFLYKKAYEELEFRKVIMTNGLSGYEMLIYFIKEKSLDFLENLLKDNPRTLKSVFFECIILPKVDFSRLDIIDCNFEGCIFTEVNFAGALLYNVNLSNSYLEKANFVGANIKEANMKKAILKKCEFRDAVLEGTDLEGADLEGARIERANLMKVNLKKTNLSKASLSWANLFEANLIGAVMKETILINTNFRRACLRGIDLSKSYLFYTKLEYGEWNIEELERDLEGTDLSGADLSGVNLSGINLNDTVLDNSILNNTIMDEKQVLYLEHKYDLQNINVYRYKNDDIVSYKRYRE